MWWFKWHSRRIIRSMMNPIDADTARVWATRLRWLYLFVAWNACLFSYKYYRDNRQKLEQLAFVEDTTSAHRNARLMQLGDVTIYRFGKDHNLVKYEFNSEQYNKEYEQKQRLWKINYEKMLEQQQNNSELQSNPKLDDN